jgi:hypothetical protein
VTVRATRTGSGALQAILPPRAGRAPKLPWEQAQNPAPHSGHHSWVAPAIGGALRPHSERAQKARLTPRRPNGSVTRTGYTRRGTLGAPTQPPNRPPACTAAPCRPQHPALGGMTSNQPSRRLLALATPVLAPAFIGPPSYSCYRPETPPPGIPEHRLMLRDPV